MRFSRGAWWAVGLIAIFAVQVPVWAQEGGGSATAGSAAGLAAQQTSAATIHVVSRETVVDVTVTDKDGKPVHGLTREHFTVKEDRKEQPIRSFHEYGSEAVSAPEKLPPNTYSNRQPASASGAVNILLLDFANAASPLSLSIIGAEDALARSLASQKLAKQDAMKYVATMSPGTKVIVLGLSKSLRTLQGATSDPALLSAAIDTMDYDTIGGAATHEQWCSQTETQARVTMEALDQIASDASAMKGKKNLLWFSVGLPWLTDPSVRAECLPDYFNDMLKTYGLLAAAQISVYPIDVRGLQAMMPNAFVTSEGRLWENVYHLSGPAYVKALQDFRQTTADEQLAMESIAEATGGAAYYNVNDLASLIAQAVDKGSNYYTLSYIPPGTKYDWGHHSIKVSVDQPGLHLVYRQSYDAVDPATIKPMPGLTLTTDAPNTTDGDMRAAMSRSMPISSQILFDVRVEPSAAVKPDDSSTKPSGDQSGEKILGTLDPAVKAKLNGKPLARYSFYYDLAASQLAFTDAKLVTSLGQTVKMPLSDDRYKQFIAGPFHFTQQIDLPPGQLFVRIGVLDKTSNKLGTVEISLTVAKDSAATKAQGSTAAAQGEKNGR